MDENDERMYISQIIKNQIYLGSIECAQSEELLMKYNIKSIVSVIDYQPKIPEFINNKQFIPIQDETKQNIINLFEGCNSFINSTEKPVLVHCQCGVSRSASFVIAYLISIGYSFRQAYLTVYDQRPFIEPNNGFINQLYLYSKQQRPTDLDTYYFIADYWSVEKNNKKGWSDDDKINYTNKIASTQFRFGNMLL